MTKSPKGSDYNRMRRRRNRTTARFHKRYASTSGAKLTFRSHTSGIADSAAGLQDINSRLLLVLIILLIPVALFAAYLALFIIVATIEAIFTGIAGLFAMMFG